MSIPTQSALEHILLLNFNTFWTLRHLMTDLCAVVAHVVCWLVLEQVLVQNFGLLEVLLNEYLWMVVRALPPFLTVPVHVVPA
jgi:hypothetical protein